MYFRRCMRLYYCCQFATAHFRPFTSAGPRIGSSMSLRTPWQPCAPVWGTVPPPSPTRSCSGIRSDHSIPYLQKGSRKSWSAMPRPPISRPAVIVYGIPLRPTSWNTGPRSWRSATSWGIARLPPASGMPNSRARRSNRSICARCRKS